MHAEIFPDGGCRLVYVVGPSGAGKDSVLREWRSMLPAGAPLAFAQRVVTRPAVADPLSEQHEPVDEERMDRLRAEGHLALHWCANGLRYGVRRAWLAALEQGQWLVVNGSRGHVEELRRSAPLAKVVLVTASPETLEQRLRARARESEAQVRARLARGVRLNQALKPDFVVHNDGQLQLAAEALYRWWSSRLPNSGLHPPPACPSAREGIGRHRGTE